MKLYNDMQFPECMKYNVYW